MGEPSLKVAVLLENEKILDIFREMSEKDRELLMAFTNVSKSKDLEKLNNISMLAYLCNGFL